MDAVVANEGDNDVEWFENKGSQNYRVRYVSNYVNTPREAAPVDIGRIGGRVGTGTVLKPPIRKSSN